MPKDSHDDSWVHVQVDQQSCAGLAGIVHTQTAHPSSDAASIKASVESSRINRSPVAAGEHQTRAQSLALPRLCRLNAILVLLSRAVSQGHSDQLRIWDHAVGCLLYTSPSPRDRTRSRMPSSA